MKFVGLIANKGRGRRGFTLAEMLIATAILAIFVSMAIVGTTALFGSGEQMMFVSKAAVLGSDLMDIVTNEIRFGESFATEETSDGLKTIKYNSTTYGDGCTIKLDSEGKLIVEQSSASASASTSDVKTKTFRPLGSAAYGGIRIKSIEFSITQEKESTRQLIACTLVLTSDGSNTIWQGSASVIPLYQKAST